MYIHPRLKSSFDFVYLFHYHQKLSGFFVWFIRFGFMAREELWKIISRAQFSRHVEANTLLGTVYTLMCSHERCIRSGGGSVEGAWKFFFVCVFYRVTLHSNCFAQMICVIFNKFHTCFIRSDWKKCLGIPRPFFIFY